MHPSSDRPDERRWGFSLIEMVIAIAIMAILAGAAVPFAIKALNQARESKTRDNLKSAYEAMFGARDRRVSNMRADFGFNPAGNLANLTPMTSPTAGAPLPKATYGVSGGVNFPWGWNGPYWTGSTRLVGGVQIPVDAWGGVLQLRLIAGQGFQVISAGANGVIDTPANQVQPSVDDLVYPAQPALLASGYGSTPILNVRNNRSTGSVNGTYSFYYRNGGAALTVSTNNFTILPGGTLPPVTLPACPAGPVQIVVNITTAPLINFSEVVDLMPGVSPVFSYTIY